MTPEILRARIKESIDEATKGVDFKGMSADNVDKIKHMITQISYEFYKKGWQECIRAQTKSIELISKQLIS